MRPQIQLDKYFTHIFTTRRVGLKKKDPDFWRQILMHLESSPDEVTVVGDNFDSDVLPPASIGIRALWLNPRSKEERSGPCYNTVHSLAAMSDAVHSGLAVRAPSFVSLYPERFGTARLALARITAADRDAIFHGWASDPAATRYLTFPTASTTADVDGFIERVARGWADQIAFNWLVSECFTREPIGAVSARIQGHKVELGYVLRVSSWGRGYMTELLSELVRRSFEIPSVCRVGAVCDVDNPASARVMEKAGLSLEGCLRAWTRHPNVSTHPRDCWSYSLVRAGGSTSL